MDFAWTALHEEWRERCAAFAREVLRPGAIAADQDERLPADALTEAQSRGLYDPGLLGAVGGDEQGLLPAIYMEELAWGCPGTAIALGAAVGAVGAIVASGMPEQAQRWMPRCFADESGPRLAAWAQTEAGAGSDAAAIALRATPDDGGWRLEGEKTLVGNGGVAGVTVLVATVEPDLGLRGQAHFVVPEGTPGMAVTRVNSKLGLRAGRLADIRFDGCHLDDELLLGGSDRLKRRLDAARGAEGASARGASSSAQSELSRALMGAAALGVARTALEEAAAALPTAARNEQHVQHALADAATELDAARLLVWRAAWMARNGVEFQRREGSMAKLKAGDVAVAIATAMVDLIGWDAAAGPSLLEKAFRDAKAFQIMEGTSQIQRTVIGRRVAGAR